MKTVSQDEAHRAVFEVKIPRPKVTYSVSKTGAGSVSAKAVLNSAEGRRALEVVTRLRVASKRK